MERDEIIKGLYQIKNWKCNGDAEMYEVIASAIRLLEQPDATSDLISRQAAIDTLYSLDEYNPRSVKAIKALPSVQPTATWLIHKWGDDAQCSNCGRSFKDVYDMDNHDQYCRHCGTHMKGIKAI